MPAWDPVFALNCFTKSMMFTPWGPSAVPTGGAGVACPAGTCSLTIAVTGLAIGSSISVRSRGLPRIPWSVSLQLQIIQLHGRRTPEQRDRHPDFSLVRQHFLHRPAEIRERPFCDLHDLADEERNRLGGLFFLDHALDAVDRVDGLLIQVHLHEDVSWVLLSLDVHLLAVLDLHLCLHKDQGL